MVSEHGRAPDGREDPVGLRTEASLRGRGDTAAGAHGGTYLGSAEGVVWHKELVVDVDGTGDTRWTALARTTYDRASGEVFGWYDPDWADECVDGSSVAVPERTADCLHEKFAGVRCAVRIGPVVAPGERLHADVDREGFNRLSLGGNATVDQYAVTVGDDQRRRYVHPTTTEPRKREPSTVDITQRDIDRLDGES